MRDQVAARYVSFSAGHWTQNNCRLLRVIIPDLAITLLLRNHHFLFSLWFTQHESCSLRALSISCVVLTGPSTNTWHPDCYSYQLDWQAVIPVSTCQWSCDHHLHSQNTGTCSCTFYRKCPCKVKYISFPSFTSIHTIIIICLLEHWKMGETMIQY